MFLPDRLLFTLRANPILHPVPAIQLHALVKRLDVRQVEVLRIKNAITENAADVHVKPGISAILVVWPDFNNPLLQQLRQHTGIFISIETLKIRVDGLFTAAADGVFLAAIIAADRKSVV